MPGLISCALAPYRHAIHTDHKEATRNQ